MNKMERVKLGRGPATAMGLAEMHCVRRCMCVFMLRSCDSARIWWQMCSGIENACVFMLKPCNSTGIWWYIMHWNWECMYVFMLEPCNSTRIWWYIICWNWKRMCVLQQICYSLPKLSCLQWISICYRKCVLQRICDSLPKVSFL